MEELWARLMQRFSPTALGDWLAKAVPSILSAVITFAVFYVVWMALDRVVTLIERRTELDKTLLAFLRSMVRYVVLIIGVLSAMGELGINITSILASLGVAGLTLGFAAKDALSNLISGIFIFWDRPFVVGDLIEIDGHYGKVEQITMRSTRVVTVDGKMLAIPNTTIVNSTVASYTNFPNIRLEVDATIATDEDFAKVRQVFLDLVSGDARYLSTPAPVMVVTALNDYNNAVQFRVWLKDETRHVAERFDLRERLYNALVAANVNMPMETIQLAPVEVNTRSAA
jgi:small conductance mechanosensitive channel